MGGMSGMGGWGAMQGMSGMGGWDSDHDGVPDWRDPDSGPVQNWSEGDWRGQNWSGPGWRGQSWQGQGDGWSGWGQRQMWGAQQ